MWCKRLFGKGLKSSRSWNQDQTRKDCRCCHIYCPHLGAPLGKIVRAFGAVSNRESRNPRCSVLQCAVVCCSGSSPALLGHLMYALAMFTHTSLQLLLRRCSVLQCAAVCCSVYCRGSPHTHHTHHVTCPCHVHTHITSNVRCAVAAYCRVLQRVAACCSVCCSGSSHAHDFNL